MLSYPRYHTLTRSPGETIWRAYRSQLDIGPPTKAKAYRSIQLATKYLPGVDMKIVEHTADGRSVLIQEWLVD